MKILKNHAEETALFKKKDRIKIEAHSTKEIENEMMKTIPILWFGWIWFGWMLFFMAAAPHVQACKIPVYRYALERWAADLFEVIVFYDDEIPLELLDRLEAESTQEGGAANFHLYDVSIHDLDSNLELIWTSTGATETPLVLVRNVGAPIGDVIWYGSADSPEVKYLVSSPARQALIETLGKGDSAAWVLLTSGNEEKDQAAREFVQTELKRMENELTLPEQDPGVQADVLRLEFPYIEVDRDDPKEAFFITQLLHTEPDLLSYPDEPILFPVFGRGRVLYALIGEGINAENIQVACEFVIGACSCQVKELNPGMDLLVSADWDSFITHSIVGEWEMSLARDPSAYSGSSTSQENAVTVSTDSAEEETGSMLKSVVLALGVLLLVNIGYVAYRFRMMSK